jgi:hypothetical protein
MKIYTLGQLPYYNLVRFQIRYKDPSIWFAWQSELRARLLSATYFLGQIIPLPQEGVS